MYWTAALFGLIVGGGVLYGVWSLIRLMEKGEPE